MEDFTALAETLSTSVGDARGALILSRDGLVLGAHPPDAESLLKPAWLRFAALGEPERGFLQFGTEIWVYLRRGAYSAFVVTGTSVRPGLVIDQVEMVLLAAEEARSKRDGLRAEPVAPPAVAPSGKPRTPLHPEPRPVESPPLVIHAAVPPAEPVAAASAAAPVPPPVPEASEGSDVSGTRVPARQELPEVPARPAAPAAPAPAHPPAPATTPAEPSPTPAETREGASVWGASNDEGGEEVDRFSLAREFSQLLQEDSDGADG